MIIDIFKFLAEFLGLLDSMLVELLVTRPKLLLQVLDLLFSFVSLQAILLLQLDKLLILLSNLVNQLCLTVEVLPPVEDVKQEHCVLWVGQIGEASDEFAVHLIAHILQEVLPESVNLVQHFGISLSAVRLQLIFKSFLHVDGDTGLAVLHVDVVVAIEGGGLLVDVVGHCTIYLHGLVVRVHIRV